MASPISRDLQDEGFRIPLRPKIVAVLGEDWQSFSRTAALFCGVFGRVFFACKEAL